MTDTRKKISLKEAGKNAATTRGRKMELRQTFGQFSLKNTARQEKSERQETLKRQLALARPNAPKRQTVQPTRQAGKEY